jgi:hypothetical protein
MDVMKTLGELGVALPTSEENVKITVEELKQKLTYYKDNRDRVTQEVPIPYNWSVTDGRILRRQRKIMRILNGRLGLNSTRKKKQISPERRMPLVGRKQLPLQREKGRIKLMETPMVLLPLLLLRRRIALQRARRVRRRKEPLKLREVFDAGGYGDFGYVCMHCN